jgi:hypothetical protein
MFKISKSITRLDDEDIGDNLLYYKYNIKYLLSLLRKGVAKDDVRYLSSYRSFEGEVFENYIYEKLLVYVQHESRIMKFVLKGHHQKRAYNHSNTLSISEKSQIVYRTKTREISEFDAMMFTKEELFFVEITLVKSVTKLKKRLRKKKALLETIFPNYKIKALIILNEGVGGVRQLPDYCTVWVTKQFSAENVLEYLQDPKKYKRKPRQTFRNEKLIEAYSLKIYPFKYYNVLLWIAKSLRLENKADVLDLDFLTDPLTQRYHNLYTKLYIGYLPKEEFAKLYSYNIEGSHDVFVALEKRHNNTIMLTYYIQYNRKRLEYLCPDENGKLCMEKKDPYGITVTEVYHMHKMMHPGYTLQAQEIQKIERSLEKLRLTW